MPSPGPQPCSCPKKAELNSVTKDKLLLDVNLASDIIFIKYVIVQITDLNLLSYFVWMKSICTEQPRGEAGEFRHTLCVHRAQEDLAWSASHGLETQRVTKATLSRANWAAAAGRGANGPSKTPWGGVGGKGPRRMKSVACNWLVNFQPKWIQYGWLFRKPIKDS